MVGELMEQVVWQVFGLAPRAETTKTRMQNGYIRVFALLIRGIRFREPLVLQE